MSKQWVEFVSEYSDETQYGTVEKNYYKQDIFVVYNDTRSNNTLKAYTSFQMKSILSYRLLTDAEVFKLRLKGLIYASERFGGRNEND